LARLFISYKREERSYAFAVRQWLIDAQGWRAEDIFVDVDHVLTGDEWERKILAEAESAEAILFIASEHSLDVRSFCYRELQHANGQILAVTIAGIQPDDERLQRAIPHRAKSRQITALDRQPTEPFRFVSPIDNTNASAQLNAREVENIGRVLRDDFGIAPDSFSWTPTAARPCPYPGPEPLMEGDEALLFGRDIEIRDAIKALEDIRESVTRRALVIQAPSGAGKSSLLRAGLWRRWRRHPSFTPLGIVRAAKGVVRHRKWGLVTALNDPRANRLNLSRDEIEARVRGGLPELLADIADADRAIDGRRRTLLLGVDQAEEMTALSPEENAELDGLLAYLFDLPKDLDLRLVLTARDDSVDATLDRLVRAGVRHEQVATWSLSRLPATRFRAIVSGPVAAAKRARWPLHLDDKLAEALADAAGGIMSEIGDALPILALALFRMVDNRRKPDGGIDLKPEDARRFIETAVIEATEEALKSADAGPDDLRRLVVPQLATWDSKAGSDGAAKRQVASSTSLFAGSRAGLRTLANALVDQRLLTRSGTEGGAAYEIAHEALLRMAPLGQLIYERRGRFEQARMLEIEAREWNAARRAIGRLGRVGDRLTEAQKLLEDEDFGPDLAREETSAADYLAACAAHEKEQTDRQRRIIGRAFVKPVVQALEEGHYEHALRLTAAGVLLAGDPVFELVPELWASAVQTIWLCRARAILKGHSEKVTIASFSPDGGRIITVSHDQIPRLWDAASGAEIAVLNGQTVASHFGEALMAVAGVITASFSPDGRRIVTTSYSRVARVWDAESGAEIAVLNGHMDMVRNASFSPDGRWIVTASHDQTGRLWDAESGKEIAVLNGHGGLVVSASFGPDGGMIVTASSDHTARLWDAESGAEIAVFGHTGPVESASFSPDGRRIVTASDDHTVRLWNTESGEEIAGHSIRVQSALFSPNGRRVVSILSDDGSARVWDAASGKELAVLNGPTGMSSASFSPDGRRIATPSWDHTVRLWDAESGAEVAALNGHTDTVRSASFSRDGSRMVTASDDHTVRLWDAENGAAIAVLKGHTDRVWRASFSPDGCRIVTASWDRTARLWDAASGPELAALNGHTDIVRSASFSPDGRRTATASWDHTARLWDAESGSEVAVLNGHAGQVETASFSPDGRRIVTASCDRTARLWDAESGAEIAVLTGHRRPVLNASFSPDGRRIVTASHDGTARLWDAESGAEIAVLSGHLRSVLSASFSPDGCRIVTASGDGTARLLDTESGAVIAAFAHMRSLSASFSPDGCQIVTVSDDDSAPRLWDAESGAKLAVLNGHRRPVRSASFSPDGRRVVTASHDDTARLWDAESGAQIAVLNGHTSSVENASFSPDGRRVVTASHDHTARLWDAGSGVQIAVLSGHKAGVRSASFSPDGRRIVTSSWDGTARLWDVSRTQVIVRERALVLAAALARGIGWRTDKERTDFLMEDAVDNLYAEAVKQLRRAHDDPEIAEVAAALAAQLHPNCYLSPTQRAEKFGPEPPVPRRGLFQ
jgi:WD40 repeat protein